MTENPGLHAVANPSGETPTAEEPAERKQPSKARRLISVALLAVLLVVAVIVFAPSLFRQLRPLPPPARSAPVASSPPALGPPPPVPVLWERLDFSAMPADVVQDLKSGKYYYNFRFPGNFGMAIDYWKKALDNLEGTDRDAVQSLVTSAERELARQFSSDSADAFVLLKQGNRAQAVALLEKMRADYSDIRARQYVWASRMLYRRRR